MKKILIIYEPQTHIELISRLLDNMKSEGLHIDAFNLRYQFFHSKRKMPLLVRLLSSIPKNRTTIFILRNLCYKLILKAVQKDYDVLDIHFFSRPYVRFLKAYKKPYKLTIWGSDFYRENFLWNEKKRVVYKAASVIQVETITVKKDLIKYESSLSNKIMVCNFGVDILDEIEKNKNSKYINKLIPNKKNQIVVTCGYNGGIAQQHIKILDQLNKLDAEIKGKLFLCIPATYGLSSSYAEEIENVLKSMAIDYCIIKNRLSEHEIAKLRLETDVVINMQTSDSLSSSLLEHLFAGNVLLLGEWLPTDTYNNYDIYYHTVNEDNLTKKMSYVVQNLSAEKERSQGNYEKIKSFATWSSVNARQFEIYKNLTV